MVEEIVGNFDGTRLRVGVVVSRFNAVVTERLEAGALDALKRHGVSEERIVLVRVPGAFEVPTAARKLLMTDRVDGVIGVGCVIRGETAHYDYICEAAFGGLAAIGRETGRPVTTAVLTTEDLEQAIQRSGGKHGNKGFEAAMALLECVSVDERLST